MPEVAQATVFLKSKTSVGVDSDKHTVPPLLLLMLEEIESLLGNVSVNVGCLDDTVHFGHIIDDLVKGQL